MEKSELHELPKLNASAVSAVRLLSGANLQNNPSENLESNFDVAEFYALTLVRNSLRVNTGNIKTHKKHLNNMMSIVQDPIKCGYLLYFSTLEHNSENLYFIMMVSRFRDVVCQDIECWPQRWEDIDDEISGQDEIELSQNTCWPSKRLLKSTIQKLVQSIWEAFLSDDAPTQIFMPAHVTINTQRRMLLLDVYGPDVFAEALIDPMETINKDILPRFIVSTLKIEMDERIRLLNTKELESDIYVPPPIGNPLLESREQFKRKRMFSLNEVITNKILYEEFLTFLEIKQMQGHLYCIRMINIFEELYTNVSGSVSQTTDCAWYIFRYFVANGSPHEVSLHSRHKKELMISLANVHVQIFDELKESVMSMISVDFNNYKSTESYRGLWKALKAARTKSSWNLLFGFSASDESDLTSSRSTGCSEINISNRTYSF